MSTSTERQRRRRARLRKEGYVDVSVVVPRDCQDAVRQYAHSLSHGMATDTNVGRLRTTLRGLKSMKSKLQEAGVKHAGVFGSTARGDDGPESDIDVVIDIDLQRVGGLIKYIKICDSIQTGLKQDFPGVRVDVAHEKSLKPGIREEAERDTIYAF